MWLKQHLENFVQPVIGTIPSSLEEPRYLSIDDMAVIKNAWRSMKRTAKGKTILLPGRDVWVFEVLARRENYPTLFIPQCSRLALDGVEILRADDYALLDTGFAGSIPKGLRIDDYLLLSCCDASKQIFPCRTRSRTLALKIESLPKYWRSGRYNRESNVIEQQLSDSEDFKKAAILTQQVYTDSSPKFVESIRRGRKSYGTYIGQESKT